MSTPEPRGEGLIITIAMARASSPLTALKGTTRPMSYRKQRLGTNSFLGHATVVGSPVSSIYKY
jgi:hypothetical protein